MGPVTVRSSVRSMLPLMIPALASFSIFQFIWVWNDLFVGLVNSGGNPDISPITVKIANLIGATSGSGGEVLPAVASCRSSFRSAFSSHCSDSSSGDCLQAPLRARPCPSLVKSWRREHDDASGPVLPTGAGPEFCLWCQRLDERGPKWHTV